MKKLITLIIVAGLALTIQAQDIKNKIGSGGEFEVLNNSDEILFKVHNAGWTGTTGEFEFNSYQGGSTIVHITDAGHNNKLYFDYAKGTTASKENVSTGSSLGIIDFNGWSDGSYRLGATIVASVSGTPSGTTMPTDLEFHTQATGNTQLRMTIKADGTVNIADLAGTYGGGQAYVIVNDAGDLIAQDAAPSNPQFNSEIQQLKAEIAELRKMIELLKEDK